MYNYNPYAMNYNQPYMQPQPQQMQQNYIPLVFVNGIEGAKAFNVPQGRMFYLKDSDSNKLYIKEADYQGRQYLQSFNLIKDEELNNSQNVELITRDDLNALHNDLTEKLNKLSQDLENALKSVIKGEINNE